MNLRCTRSCSSVRFPWAGALLQAAAEGTLPHVIDISTEQLLRLRELPAYLESRGFGKRVSWNKVRSWVEQGCAGVRLEAVTIDGVQLTSVEAVQRWVEQQTRSNQTASGEPATGAPGQVAETGGTAEHRASVHLLTEHRVMPTSLDQMIHALDHPRSTRAFTAGVLFRAGLRTPEDARLRGLDALLTIPGIGTRSREVVGSLWRRLQENTEASGSQQ